MPVRTDLPELRDLLPTADVIDVKTATGAVPLRACTSGLSVRSTTSWSAP